MAELGFVVTANAKDIKTYVAHVTNIHGSRINDVICVAKPSVGVTYYPTMQMASCVFRRRERSNGSTLEIKAAMLCCTTVEGKEYSKDDMSCHAFPISMFIREFPTSIVKVDGSVVKQAEKDAVNDKLELEKKSWYESQNLIHENDRFCDIVKRLVSCKSFVVNSIYTPKGTGKRLFSVTIK